MNHYTERDDGEVVSHGVAVHRFDDDGLLIESFWYIEHRKSSASLVLILLIPLRP